MIIKVQPLPHVARALRGNKRLKILKMTQSGVYCLTDEETYQNLIRQAQENSEAAKADEKLLPNEEQRDGHDS
ncbi:hypothetical protein [Rubinisphaera sp.]|uniref:hypothetical protein n=1 Tax=Rubinisphaera sp. TaxID=2024857 RepID=UPI000C0D2F95|nr:hypothetical protein [Rubinisphaera sp.]MBV08649.1 hypothetical protein [Rubinisphaera sp.]HCS51722.1 hypothetical protein [Planctomycetaceae bacterium]|tara:strand:- start:239 stop:457 length:219 start_codon:yes stop_codon:yes gene_type:complete